MLRFCRSRLAIGAYALFMMEQKKNPALSGLPVAQRGKVTSKLYKALAPAERAALEKRAKATPSPKRNKMKGNDEKEQKPKRKPSKYAQFVKANLPKYSQLPNSERLAAVAKLWRQQQQQQQQPKKKMA
ncbi:putative kinetoplast DNA-associated protein [Trypanosoma cruzi]|uniref:Kinetoplast DNA-associated protein, putative n=2 Tax=Trypanosoma cruzi TaxID=5693 RepID=Q4CY61_TRYCC|nr:kinetoplast DNA-associated protein, putative [Trypanosoma cruzi]EAN85213.1 kinetoplast DNA-associated protein, putative [Trypanosoma cruzi]PWV17154.1 putative kinetoplast DNA-associated protein [Trypanosoma cruzi]RNC48144.1 kinetoplast DNA-associated protein [Trypanosoma cruzi]|eukprot:XP_807064.1 kinetoplast DNA-associated protein [Trypanosoma cruzi strain CL Brener]